MESHSGLAGPVRGVGLGLEPLSDRLTLPSWTARFHALASARSCVLSRSGLGQVSGRKERGSWGDPVAIVSTAATG